MALSVLMIDAEQPFANDVASQLGEHNMQIEVIADGKQGLEKARKGDDKPDLIVLCVELPKMSGYSICNKLKKDNSLHEIPLIITSSEATPETFEQHKRLKTRADGYLIKPFTQEQILEEIHNLIPESADDDAESLLDLGEESADEGFDLSGFADDMSDDDDFGDLDVDDDDIELDDIEEVDDDEFSLDEVADDDALSALGEDAVDALGDLDVEETVDEPAETAGMDEENLLEGLDDVAPLALEESPEPELEEEDKPELKQEEEQEPEATSAAPAMSSAAKAEQDKQLREVRRQNGDLQARVAELETRLKAAEDEARKKGADLSNVQSSSSSNQREVLDLKQKLHEKEKELFTLKEDAFSKEKAAFDASEKLTEIQHKNDEIVAQMADRDAKIATLESKVSSITEERNSIEQESQQRIAELEQEVEKLGQERDSNKAEAEKTQKRLENKLEAAEKLANDRGERVETLSSELADKESQIADLYQKSQHDQDIRERAFKAVEIASTLLAGEVENDSEPAAAEMAS